MRYLLPVVLFCSIAGFAHAQSTMTQLPSGAQEVQILGNTYYKSGDTFYRFNEQGGYFYETNPPRVMDHQSTPNASVVTNPGVGLTSDQIEGCRNAAADKSNAVPNRGSSVYINEYNRCISDLQRQ
ncbi:hypothetical protein [Microbulbifer agarilyticus]|uniref:hypothetical protein n=1 Tax=Microbulbifer agarilyticus TaxID=260552 RepID=UPI001C9895B9|nr:hypothetical protein [Microbulbifer agarilyticus]MBY6191248.1 hypothetical protein [Microbulbifer agarilyticus]MBY6211849.1 hypothetical protein [Microbulbifer agarilyticus]MCA0893126.1 hypothetical protein [Microbulbifer agarilyticus]